MSGGPPSSQGGGGGGGAGGTTPAAVWAFAARTLTSFGTLVADVTAAVRAAITADHGTGDYLQLPLSTPTSSRGKVSVDNEIVFQACIVDVNNGAIAAVDITPGTYDIIRNRNGVLTTIVNGAAFTAALGEVFFEYNFPVANWQLGDSYIVQPQFDTTADIGGVTYYASIGCWAGMVENIENWDTQITNINGETDASIYNQGGGSRANNSLLAQLVRWIADTVNDIVTDTEILYTQAIGAGKIPIANTLSDILHKDGSYTYDNTTDSLEAQRDEGVTAYDNLEDFVGRVTDTDTSANINFNSATEQTLFTATVTDRRHVAIHIEMDNADDDSIIRVKRDKGGGSYQTFASPTWTTSDDDGVYFQEFVISSNFRVTIEPITGGGSATQAVGYEYL